MTNNHDSRSLKRTNYSSRSSVQNSPTRPPHERRPHSPLFFGSVPISLDVGSVPTSPTLAATGALVHPHDTPSLPHASPTLPATGAPAHPHATPSLPHASPTLPLAPPPNAELGPHAAPPPAGPQFQEMVMRTMQETLEQMRISGRQSQVQGAALTQTLAGLFASVNKLNENLSDLKKERESDRQAISVLAHQVQGLKVDQDRRHAVTDAKVDALAEEIKSLRVGLQNQVAPPPRPQAAPRPQVRKTPHNEETENIRIIKSHLENDFKLETGTNTFPAPYLKNTSTKLAENAKILVGDHGAYLELDNLPQGAAKKFEGKWYDHFDLNGTKIYAQKLTVEANSNPPRGPFSCRMNREGGYADYIPGKFYVCVSAIMRIAESTPLFLNASTLSQELSVLPGYFPRDRRGRGSRDHRRFGRGGGRHRHRGPHHNNPMEF